LRPTYKKGTSRRRKKVGEREQQTFSKSPQSGLPLTKARHGGSLGPLRLEVMRKGDVVFHNNANKTSTPAPE